MTDTHASTQASPAAEPAPKVTAAWLELLGKVAAGHISCQDRPRRTWLHSPTAAIHYRLPKTVPDKLLAAGLIELSDPRGPLETRRAALTAAGAAALAQGAQ